MEKEKHYACTDFKLAVIREAFTELERIVDSAPGTTHNTYEYFHAQLRDESWHYDDFEEFLSDYPKSTRAVCEKHMRLDVDGESSSDHYKLRIDKHQSSGPVSVDITVAAPDRTAIATVFNVFEKHAENSRLPPPKENKTVTKPEPTIFIGHGHSEAWRDLRDHLQDKHGYKVEAFESGARAGHAIRDIMERMLSNSTFAILVYTRDDHVGDGKYRARQNVVHETGLFQGRLGFSRAVALREDGVEDFSNLAGIQEIRFEKERIASTFGEVLAVLKREFGNRRA